MVEDDALVTMAVAAGLGALALRYLNDDERRDGFIAWLDGRRGGTFPRAVTPAVTLECAELACIGLHGLFAGQAAA